MASRIRRRTFLAGLGGLTAFTRTAPAAWGPSPAPPTDSWPQFRRDPRLTGVAAGPLPPVLREIWSYEAGEAIDSSAAIVSGVVYVGCRAGQLLALDLAKGALRFKYEAGAEIGESSPPWRMASSTSGTCRVSSMP